MADVKVLVNSETVGLSTIENDKIVGRGNLEYDAKIGLGTTEYKETVGLDSTIEYKETVGLGKSGTSPMEAERTIFVTAGGTHYEAKNDIVPDERYGDCEDEEETVGGTESGWREYGAQWLRSMSSSEDEWQELSPKERARRGDKKRRINASTKKKLFHMGSKLFQVLLTCAITMGGMAEEALVEPVKDLWMASGLGWPNAPGPTVWRSLRATLRSHPHLQGEDLE